MNHLLNGTAALPHLGVIRAEGIDAASFLQGQLTQDFASLGAGEARLAAFCNAKGRVQASFVGIRRGPTEFLLVTSRDILAPTLKRLSMFVLRAKAKLSDATADFDLYGLAGDVVTGLAVLGTEPWSEVDLGPSSVVRLYPADGQQRALWLAPFGSPPPEGMSLSHSLWLWGEVRSAVVTITVPIVDAFVPQMLNYESVGGVNFKKGCYPGQEIVARSQFRGVLKRRAYLASAASPLAAGQEVFHASDTTQPCGLVAQSAAAPAGGWAAIVSIQVAAAKGGALTVGSADGPVMEIEALPYLLLTDI